MKIIVRQVAVAACVVGLSVPSIADEAMPGVAASDNMGHAPPLRRALAGATPTTFTGNIALTLTVNIASSGTRISRDAPVKCVFNANVHNADYSDSVAEVSQATVAIVGSQVTCKLVIPYSWPLYDATNDLVYMSYNISFFDDNGNGRNTYVQMPTIAVPANGSNLTYSRTARI